VLFRSYLLRLATGEVLFAHRVPATSLHLSRDNCRTWQGPYAIDNVGGAYAGLVTLRDGTVLCIYYEEGEGSAVRVMRLRVTDQGIERLRLE